MRLIGAGPPVLLLHASPRSSASLVPLAERLGGRLTCILPDTPGFGLSPPLRMARPEAGDFADVLLETAEALGLGPMPVYGTHTGAALAAAAVLRAPARVTAAVLDGFALFDPAEQAEILSSYLTPFRPALDGTHAAWLWSRVRDQMTAFPWNQVSDAQRLRGGPPPLATLQAIVQDFLLAGDAYRAGYAAAFRFDHFAALREAESPLHLVAPGDDLLAPLMPRAKGQGAAARLHPIANDREALHDLVAALLEEAASDETTSAAELAERAR
ncbi:MAG: alpha/beta hydrolase, partial [Pseudomonadota bacterium]